MYREEVALDVIHNNDNAQKFIFPRLPETALRFHVVMDARDMFSYALLRVL
jgi:hypothetical protein